MHKTYYIKGSTLGKYLYKEYSNLLTRVKKLAKKNQFYRKIEEHRNIPKKIWDVLRNLLPNKPASHVPNFIIVDDKNISDPISKYIRSLHSIGYFPKSAKIN